CLICFQQDSDEFFGFVDSDRESILEQLGELGAEDIEWWVRQKVEGLAGIYGFVVFGFLFRDIDWLGVVPMDFIGAGMGEVARSDWNAFLVCPADSFATFGGDPLEYLWVFSWVGDENGARPIGDIGGAGSGVHPI